MNQPKMAACLEQRKEKVKRARIVERDIREERYYEIEYVTLDGETHIGYGSYRPEFVHDWLETCFEYCEVDHGKEDS